MKISRRKLIDYDINRYKRVYYSNMRLVNKMFEYAKWNFRYSDFHTGIRVDLDRYKEFIKWKSPKEYEGYVKSIKYFLYRCFRGQKNPPSSKEIDILFDRFEIEYGLRKSYDE